MSYPFKNGQTSIVLRFKLLDSSSTTGAGLTGLTSASASLIISTIADNEATATAYTQAGATIEAVGTLGTFAAPTGTKCRFKEVDSTNHKGVYEFQFADARFAVASAKSLLISVAGATNLAQADFVVPLVSDDPYVAKPANYASFSIDASGRVDVIKVAGTTQTAKDIGGAVPAAAAGASGGLLISGSNSGTTTLGAFTVTGATTYTGATTHTGNVVLSDGLTISAPSTGNRAGLSITGNGSGAAIIATGGATGIGFNVVGGGTSGDGIKVTTTSGHGVNLAPVGTSMHGFLSTGGNGGTSDGFKAAAGTGGVDIRGNITGNITGTLATLTTYTGNTVQTGDSFARLGVAGAGLTALGDVRIANLDATVTSRMASYTQPTGFLAATFPAGTVANTTNITAGVITTTTNLTTNNDKTGYSLVAGYDLAKTAAQAGDAMALTSGERNSTADALLNRDLSTGSDSGSTTVRTTRQAMRFLRNKWSIAAGTLTVCKEDDVTASWTAAVSTDAAALPIISNDPAGP